MQHKKGWREMRGKDEIFKGQGDWNCRWKPWMGKAVRKDGKMQEGQDEEMGGSRPDRNIPRQGGGDRVRNRRPKGGEGKCYEGREVKVALGCRAAGP